MLFRSETRLPTMLAALRDGADLAVGSRHVEGGDNSGLSSGFRHWLSDTGIRVAQWFLPVKLTDPMSGFFMMRRAAFYPLASELQTQGFKILLDIVISAKGGLRIAEEPYVFAARQHGESKLDAQVGLDFIGLLLAKMTGGAVTPRFLSFALVGTIGLGVHLAMLRGALGFDFAFPQAQALATFIAMTGNFFLNNQLTYRDKRLSGGAALRGLLSFYAISAVGALTNVGAASWLYAYEQVWWLAGASGALMGEIGRAHV